MKRPIRFVLYTALAALILLVPLKHNADGSLDLYIQSESPGKDKEGNWLPAPEGSFYAVLRMYGPEKQILDGSWKSPPVELVK